MTVRTEHLLLRPYTPADFDDYFAYIMDEDLQYMLGLHNVADRASAQLTFRWLLQNREFLALCPEPGGSPIGHICLHPADALPGRPGLDLTFAIHKDHRRQGLMEEALRALIAELFSENRADYLQCEFTSFNAPSRCLQQKLGFRLLKSEQIEDFTLYTGVLECRDVPAACQGGC